jgi:SAM-dependent methyltransferase
VSTYIFDQAAQRELDRLRALEDMYDDATRHRLTTLGVTSGWRCLEVGCGAGGIAYWLAETVSPRGCVVATDLDPRFMDRSGRKNLEVVRHDILTDPLEDNHFDLIHARAVLEHLPACQQALERLVAATRPGGWVVIEDTDFGGPMLAATIRYTMPAEVAALGERCSRAVEALFRGIGANPNLGPALAGMLRASGLVNVDMELHGRVAWGGRARDFGHLTVETLRTQILGAGLLTEEEIEQFASLIRQPEFGYMPLPIVTAWGQRPEE